MFEILLVFLGGSIGAGLRYLISLLYNQSCWGTLIINVMGCFFIGFISYIAVKNENIVTPNLKLFLTTGIAGGFTTFSTFSYESCNLIKNGQIYTAAGYIFFTYILGLGAVFFGFLLAKFVLLLIRLGEETVLFNDDFDENNYEEDNV